MPEARKVTPKPTKRTTTKGTKGNTLDPQRIVAEIVAGRHTGHLADVVTACVAAAASRDSSLRWQIKLDPLGDGYGGRTLTEDNISLAAVTTAERFAGHSWKTLSPAESAQDCHALIVGWLVEDEGLTVDEATETVKAVSLADAMDMVGVYEVIHGPKGASTPTAPSTG